jgi:protein gp37
MSEKTDIQWCDSTVNPIMGCSGCELWEPKKGIRRCYAGVLHERGKGKKPGHAPSFEIVTPFPGRVIKAAALSDLSETNRDDKPWLNGAPRMIFVSDMGDALSKSVSFAYLEQEVLRAVASVAGRRHRWLWLTKRPERMAEFHDWARTLGWKWPMNLWVGTSVTSTKSVQRVHHLAAIGDDDNRVMKFLSLEPQSDDIDISPMLGSVHWVIQGGESGGQALPFHVEWARRTRDDCRRSGVPYFLKQLGRAPIVDGVALNLRHSHGGNWREWPADVAVREVPGAQPGWSRPTS